MSSPSLPPQFATDELHLMLVLPLTPYHFVHNKNNRAHDVLLRSSLQEFQM